MARACPVNFQQVDATTVRIISLLVLISVVAALFAPSFWLFLLLATDFTIRLYGNVRHSPFYMMAAALQERMGWESSFEDAAAKRLAAHFGLLFMLLLALFSWMGLPVFLYATTGVFLLCSSLEVLFGYCLGCKIYYLYQHLLRLLKP